MSVRDTILVEEELPDTLLLGAGACRVCGACSYPIGEGCRFPDKAVGSVEAYGIDAKKLLEANGLRYVNGVNTVSYARFLLYGRYRLLSVKLAVHRKTEGEWF
jgi:predicted metal-binding protein